MKKLISIFLSLFLLFVVSSCGRKDKVVARFNGTPVMLEAVAREMAREGLPRSRSGLAAKMTAVSNLILKDLFLLDAREKGYLERQDVREKLEKQKKELVKRMVIEKVVGSPSVALSAGDLRKYTSIVTCRLIFFNAPVCLDFDYRKGRYEEARNCARLVNSRNFSEMADLYTDFPGNLKGGFLGALPASNLAPAVRSVVARMRPGEISDVIQSDKGCSIVKLEKFEKAVSAGTADRYHVSSIFLSSANRGGSETLEKARELWRQLKIDPSSFKDLANRWSEDPENRNGGRLRPFVYEQMIPVIAEASWKTPRGRVSRILSDRSGFYLLLVDSVRLRSAKEMSELRKNKKYFHSLKQRILGRKAGKLREDRFGRYRERLLAGAKVVKDYSCFTNASMTNADAAGAAVLLKVLYNNTVFTYADFLAQFQRDSARFGGRATYIDKVNLFESRLLVPELVFADGLKRGFMQSRRFQKEYSGFCDNTVFSAYVKDLVDAWQVTEAQTRGYYEAHKDRFEKYPYEKIADIVRRQLLEDLRPVIARQKMVELLHNYKLEIDPWALMDRKERRLAGLRQAALKAEQSSNLSGAAETWAVILKKDPSGLEAVFNLFRIGKLLGGSVKAARFIDQAVSSASRNMDELAKQLGDPESRQSALELMSRTGDREAVLALVRQLQNADRRFLPEIIRVLGELRTPFAAEPVLNLLRSERRNIIASSNLPVVAASCLALGRIGGETAKSYLAGWLTAERDYRLQQAIISGLGECKDPSLDPLLKGYRASPSPDVRRAAASALSSQTNSGQR